MHSPEEGGTKQADEQKVVEMAGLKRGILPVVCEAKDPLRRSPGIASCECIQRSTEWVSKVVADERPSADRAARRFLSFPWAGCTTLQFRQKRNLPGWNEA